MDLKALMQKLEAINKAEILTESEKKETTWTDKSGKKHPATQVKGDKYTCKEAEKESKPKKNDLEEGFTSSIARALAEEFGYALDEADPNDPNATAAVDANTKKMQADRAAKDGTTNYTSGLDTKPAAAPNAAAVAGVTPKPQVTPAAAPAAGGVANPYTGADAAKFAAMSPEDQAWLTKGGGKPDINDQFILARAPNKGKPAPQKVDPNQADRDDAEMGAAMTAMAAGGNSTSAATGVGIPGEEAAAQAAADKAAAGGAPGAQDDATGVDAAVAANAADDAKRAANPWPADKNAIIAFQKANGLTADGLIGPKTMAALQKSGATPPAGFKPAGAKAATPKAAPTAVAAGSGRGGQGGATAAELAAYQASKTPAPYNAAKDSQAANTAPAATTPPVATTFAQDTAARKKALTPAELAGKKPQTTVAMGAPNADKRDYEESIQSRDDQILAIIKGIRVS